MSEANKSKKSVSNGKVSKKNSDGGITTKGSKQLSAADSATKSAKKVEFANQTSFSKIGRLRKSFGKNPGVDIDTLTSIQHNSYDDFLQANVDPAKRRNVGLQRVFNKVFPILNHNKMVSLEFMGYKLLEPKDDVSECKKGDLTYAAPLQAKFKRTVCAIDEKTKEKQAIDVCEQDVFLGAVPLMTEKATFVIAGVERVLVSQLHRAPGVFFEVDTGKNSTSGRSMCTAKIIPGSGSWVEFEYGGARDECYVKIDKKRKISAVTFLMCLNSVNYKEGDALGRSGMTKGEILALYYDINTATRVSDGWVVNFIPREWSGSILNFDLIHPKTREVLVKEGTRITVRVLKDLAKKDVKQIYLQDLQFVGSYLADDIVDVQTGAILIKAGEELTYETLTSLLEHGLKDIKFLSINRQVPDTHWRNNVLHDSTKTREEALGALYRVFRPGEHPSINSAYDLFHGLFFHEEKYDLSEVGRVRLNSKLDLEIPESTTTLTKPDIVEIVKRLLAVKAGRTPVDDVDSLENRRIRSAGELLEVQCLTAMTKIKRLIREKMSGSEISQTTPHSLFNSLLFTSAIREFFTKSQLSQFMEHTNPLSALTHVRKVSSLGPGGMQRGSAVVDVRDAHISSNGKLCPIQTPEGANIGLIHSPAMNARVDQYGFLQGMYRRVKNGVITDEIEFLSAIDDHKYHIAYGDCARNKKGELEGPLVACKKAGEVVYVTSDQVDYIDSSTNHIVSVSASLIPGLEKNDATRDLMGANMQGQAVPGVFNQAPIVGTGMEEMIMRNTKACLYAKRNGVVMQVEGNRIVVKGDEFDDDLGLIDIYKLNKYSQSNAGTCVNQIPVVKVGDKVVAGQLIADGQASSKGELSLGANVRVAFLSQPGNFEDSIIISQRLLKDDVFSSVHIQEFEVVARETKIGSQEITRDIPDLDGEKLWHLDESGIIQKGTTVKPGMILVGRITPRLDSPVTGEDKLVRAIFKNAASTVKDDSLYVPAGVSGTVIDVKVFSRRSGPVNERTLAMQKMELFNAQKDRDVELETLDNSFTSVFSELILGQTLSEELKVYVNKVEKIFTAGHQIVEEDLKHLNIERARTIRIKGTKQKKVTALVQKYEAACQTIQDKFLHVSEKIKSGVDLQPGVLKIVKIYIAVKRDIQVGDKLAGRHGNKGIISYCLPESEMPFTADGKPVDMVLNPLGVVSRMNLGQILEIHLGKAAEALRDKLRQLLVAYGYNFIKPEKQEVENTVITEEDGDLPAISVQNVVKEKLAPMSLDVIRKFVNEIYDNHKDYLDSLNDEDFLKQCLYIVKDGVYFASPVFDGASEQDIHNLLEQAGLSKDGQETLYDGKTGMPLDSKVTVGHMYMLKLHHLVADKMHARSTGPYSAVTLQPLGGKAQDGGQRAGEMENWAFQAYGSASVLLEMMTIKSDSVEGRTEAYKSITNGMSPNFLSTPAVFSVFAKELEALCLKVDCKQREVPLRDGWRREKDTEKISIRLKSSDEIRAESYGEVTRPETINYRTGKPESEGLCCPKIFGPVKDYECGCGKYKKMKDKGKVCDKCGVEVTVSWVRRERMGHIELPAPVLHPWFYRILPSKICTMLDMNFGHVDSVLNMDRYIVVDAGMTMLSPKQLLTEHEYQQAIAENGPDTFTALTGAEAIKELLTNMDLEKEREKVRDSLATTQVALKRKKLVARLKLIEGFMHAKVRPEWMVLNAIPVLPADLRPLVPIEGGRFASSDLNELYRRLVNRVKRLQRLKDLRAPEILIRSEKRLLQEAVDNLFDNGRRERPVLGANKRPLRSLSDGLKGKQGIFRQNLLGKRVDYSGRSVIAVDAGNLKLHQCGLPKMMALELFKPFVYARLLKDGVSLTLKEARKMVDEERPEVWDALKEVVYRHPVILNRAPTLHRLSMRAFEPVLIEGQAIRLHPLTCSAFNADFDGDQMAVHVPLSQIAQLEARVLMCASVNQLKPSDGRSAILPSKDMILGLYYLTYQNDQIKTDQIFYSIEDAIAAYKSNVLNLHAVVKMMHEGEWIETTAGRAILFKTMASHNNVKFALINKAMRSKDVVELFSYLYQYCGQEYTGIFADDVMRLGFEYAAKSGISFSLADLHTPSEKDTMIAETTKQAEKLQEQYYEGLITDDERYNKVQDIWIKCIEELSDTIVNCMSVKNERGLFNPIYSMIDSGARGSKQQLIYMIGMRGLVVKPNGEILEHPVRECYQVGLKMSSFFATIHGVRKGFADVALRTAVAGYLTRRLVDVAQDVVITEQDCGTSNGLEKKTVFDGENVFVALEERIAGRVLASDVMDTDGKVLVPANTLLEVEQLDVIKHHSIGSVKVRAALTCQSKEGVCAKCYGIDLGRQKMVNPWTAIGVIAAQSISEPGTQLTMRSFHAGGGAKKDVSDAFFDAPEAGVVKLHNSRVLQNREGVQVVVCKGMECILMDNKQSEIARYELPYGAKLFVEDGQKVEAGKRLVAWEPYIIPIITESEGIVKYNDLIDGVSLRADEFQTDIATVIDWKKHHRRDMKPAIQLIKENGEPILTARGAELRYMLNVGTTILVKNGTKVYPGDLIGKFSLGQLKSSDITGGLPVISQLFEASKPKKCAVLSDISGTISFTKDYRGNRRLVVEPSNPDEDVSREYIVPSGAHLLVQEGHEVKKGDVLVDGAIYSADILRILGEHAMIEHFIQAVQNVYRAQGIVVNEKHIEVIVKPMLQTVEVTDPGDSIYLIGERVDKTELKNVNEELKAQGKQIAGAMPYLQGISDRTLNKSSLASAAFQDSIKYMANAACKGVEEDVSKNVKTAMMTGNYPEQGTGGYLYQLHRETEALEKLYVSEKEEDVVTLEQGMDSYSQQLRKGTESEGLSDVESVASEDKL